MNFKEDNGMNEAETEIDNNEVDEVAEEVMVDSIFPISKEEEDEHKELTMKTIEWWDKFNQEFGKNYAYPTITFTLRGAAAGTATYQKQLINYNIGLYRDNKEGYYNRTIPHEIAHLFNFRMYVERTGSWGKRLMPHGIEWKQIMRRMKVDPKRCHSYKVEKVRRVSKDYIYKCSCREHKISSILHNRMEKGDKFYKCNVCKGRISYVGKKEVSPIATIPMDKVEIEKKKKELEDMLAMLG
jgi:SprT protein